MCPPGVLGVLSSNLLADSHVLVWSEVKIEGKLKETKLALDSFKKCKANYT